MSGGRTILAFNGKHLVRCELRKGVTMKDFYTVDELAKHFGVDPKTIYRQLWTKVIPAYKVGQQWRIAKKDLIWLKR